MEKIHAFMVALAAQTRGEGRIYLTGGATALLQGWRSTTIDIDLKAEPEPAGFFEALVGIKDQLDIHVKLAAPDQFIPPLPGWQERSLYIVRHGSLDFFHYDCHSQALSKIERGHGRDLSDVAAMLTRKLISVERLHAPFLEIEPGLIRYPAIDPGSFRAAVTAFCSPTP